MIVNEPSPFGGHWSDRKLQALESYLNAYRTALKNTPFRFVYIDAFAGAGSRPIPQPDSEDYALFVDEDRTDENSSYRHGSPLIALKTDPPFHEFIFIECKPVDNAHPVGTHYCGKGIIRFIQGDYAWAMQDGIMLAYAASGYDVTKKLLPHLSPHKPGQFAATEKLDRCPKSREDCLAERTLISTHQRDFTYSENGGCAPNIMLRHIWLQR